MFVVECWGDIYVFGGESVIGCYCGVVIKFGCELVVGFCMVDMFGGNVGCDGCFIFYVCFVCIVEVFD